MKRIFLLAVVIAALSAITPASAQVETLAGSPYNNALDTVTNTASETWSKKIKVGNNENTVSVASVIAITKISGILAGTATFQGSLDNITWVNVGSANTVTDVTSQAFKFESTAVPPYPFWRWIWTGAGTMQGSASAKILAK